MLTYALDRRGELPLYEFLCRRIREDIREGRLRAGEKMPSKRGLAEHLGVSVATVENAYAQLLLEGYLRAEERRGYFVESLPVTEIRKAVPPAALQAEEAEPEWFADFRTNRVPGEQFPFSVWAKLMREVLTERDAALLRPMPGGGTLALRRAIAAYLGRFRGIAAEP
ncbi:MAG: GntR family transcriptional regulator, partial [Neglectibacter timonensis]